MSITLEGLKNQIDIIKAQIGVMQEDTLNNNKAHTLEFNNIGGAFKKFGELVDLLYLEVSVLIELFDKKGVITQEEFTKQLEETGKKIEEDAKKRYDEMIKKEASKGKNYDESGKEDTAGSSTD